MCVLIFSDSGLCRRKTQWIMGVFCRCALLEKKLGTTDLWWGQVSRHLASSHRMLFGVVNSGEYMQSPGHGFISRGVYNIKALRWTNSRINSSLETIVRGLGKQTRVGKTQRGWTIADFSRVNRGRDECGLADGKTEAVSWQNSEPAKSEFMGSQNQIVVGREVKGGNS